ncbi:hypothetical protein ACPEIF_27215 [Streptomyces sp. NPDC012600]|uniref:hypothetical protein n=1 Tax=Streptomyces sp. NPDC012600 TaxID=3415005 RepID=UPI003C2D5DAA
MGQPQSRRRDRHREQAREQARERRLRHEALAGTITPASAPLVWRPGWGCRVLAAVWFGVLVLFTPFFYGQDGQDLAAFRPVDWFFRVWAVAVALWILARLGMWRITADRDGVSVPGFFTVARIPWADVGEAVPRRYGFVSVGHRTAGAFTPPVLARLLRRPVAVEEVADHLTVLARHPGLRPTGKAGPRTRGLPYIAWTPLPFLVIAALHLLAL